MTNPNNREIGNSDLEIQKMMEGNANALVTAGMTTVGGILETMFGALLSLAKPEIIPLAVLAGIVTAASFIRTYHNLFEGSRLYRLQSNDSK